MKENNERKEKTKGKQKMERGKGMKNVKKGREK